MPFSNSFLSRFSSPGSYEGVSAASGAYLSDGGLYCLVLCISFVSVAKRELLW